MNAETKTPTELFYEQLQFAYDHLNKHLFNGELPSVLITIQRQNACTGHFAPARWGNKDGESTDELSLNPAYFGNQTLVEIFQTIVHEQVHCWQHQEWTKKKETPGRATYHNADWATKMEKIGLQPSDTGLPGGKRTGQKMSDYPLPGGQFEKACIELLESGFDVTWMDRQPMAIEPEQADDSSATDSASVEEEELADPTIPAQPLAMSEGESIVAPLEPQDTTGVNDLPPTSTADEDENSDQDESKDEAPNVKPVRPTLSNPILEQKVSDLIPGIKPANNDNSKKKRKSKYSCPNPDCKLNVWGKSGLDVRCGTHDKKLVDVNI